MALPPLDVDRRRPVWSALSELFLDTELGESGRWFIAQRLLESGYTDEELDAILYQEVFPVCRSNMYPVGGIWAGFDLDWLVEQILHNVGKYWKRWRLFQLDRWIIRGDWREVKNMIREARAFKPACLTPTVLAISRSISEETALDRLPILADALEESGCTNGVILEHCRGEVLHKDGCWVVGLLLRKD